jgi:short-subunit dehydrogenase
MIATGFAQNGADVYIASRKEKQLQEVRSPHALMEEVFTGFV